MKKIFALIILATTLGSTLSGCIVVPDEHHGHYRDHDHYDDRGRY